MVLGPLRLGVMTMHWLPGGDFRLDGGGIFGPVPKTSWQRRWPAAADNTLRLCNDPLLVDTGRDLLVVDGGLGDALSPRLREEYRVTTPWALPKRLAALGIECGDIGHVVITHGDFDHVGGLVRSTGSGREATFPNAIHYMQRREWHDMRAPHPRSAGACDAAILDVLPAGRLELVDEEAEICPGVVLRHSGGHTRGHQVVELHTGAGLALCPADLMPTHCHGRPLWQCAYDSEPLVVVDRKIEYLARYDENTWYLLYHDPYVRAMRLGPKGEVRETWPMPWPEVAALIAREVAGGEAPA